MFRFAYKNIIKTTLAAAGILGACGVPISTASAVTYSQDIGVSFTFNPSISVSLSSNDLIIPNLTPGTASDSNVITINVKTNNITGYTLNATVGNNTTYNTRDLIHNNSNITDKFSSLNFGTIVATNTNLSDNTWGYSYSLNNGTNWIANTISGTSAGYSGLPLYNDETNITTLKESTGPAETASGDDVKFKIAAMAADEIASGEYNNVINFTAVANPEPQLEPINCSTGNVICYSANSLGPVEGTMGEQSEDDNGNSLTGGSTVTLLASNFSRDGYGFAGWNTEPDYSGAFYGPNETITTPSDMSAGLPLYAIWVQSAGSMQDDVVGICRSLIPAPIDGSANLVNVSALTDERDNDTYAIAKLADGKCWMIENLRLGNTAAHNSDGLLAQGYDQSFSGLANPETSTTFANTTVANSLYSTDGSTSNMITGDKLVYRFPRYDDENTSDRASSPAPSTNNAKMYSYGNYYTWSAAIADTTEYSVDEYSITSTSICPVGWHLSTGGGAYSSSDTGGVNTEEIPSTYRDYYNLGYSVMGVTAYNGAPQFDTYYGDTILNSNGDTANSAFRRFPNNFVYSGYLYNGAMEYRGEGGYYWTSAVGNIGKSAYSLAFANNCLRPGTSPANNFYGRTVRCVAGS